MRSFSRSLESLSFERQYNLMSFSVSTYHCCLSFIAVHLPYGATPGPPPPVMFHQARIGFWIFQSRLFLRKGGEYFTAKYILFKHAQNDFRIPYTKILQDGQHFPNLLC